MDEEFAKILCELLNGLEETVRRVKEELSKYIEKSCNWCVIESPKPVPLDDRAIMWLSKKLDSIKEKHPNLKFEWIKTAENLIAGLRYLAENEEVSDDVQAVAKWAFERAAERPVQPNK